MGTPPVTALLSLQQQHLYGILKPVDGNSSPIRLMSQTHTFPTTGSGNGEQIAGTASGQPRSAVKLTVGQTGRAYLSTHSPNTLTPLTSLLRNKDTFVIAGRRYKFITPDSPEAIALMGPTATAAVAVSVAAAAPGSGSKMTTQLFETPFSDGGDKENHPLSSPMTSVHPDRDGPSPLGPTVAAALLSPEACQTPVGSVPDALDPDGEDEEHHCVMEQTRNQFTPLRISEMFLSPAACRGSHQQQQQPQRCAEAETAEDTEHATFAEKLQQLNQSTSSSPLDVLRATVRATPQTGGQPRPCMSPVRALEDLSPTRGVVSCGFLVRHPPASTGSSKSRGSRQQMQSVAAQTLPEDEAALRRLESMLQESTDKIGRYQRRAQKLRTDFSEFRSEVSQQLMDLSRFLESHSVRVLSTVRSKAEESIHELSSSLAHEKMERRRLHNELIEALGNIRVHCRIRPAIASLHSQPAALSEGASILNSSPVVMPDKAMSDERVVLVNPFLSTRKSFDFDFVHGPDATEDHVYREVRPLLTSLADGYNICIAAYGQTSSGKTHTMKHLTRRALDALAGGGRDYELSMFEIYNNEIRDLLVASPPSLAAGSAAGQLETGSVASSNTMNLKRVRVSRGEAAEALRWISVGEERRAQAATLLNAHSSRSHSIVWIYNLTSGSKLTLVDLAGSECVSRSGAAGQALVEAKHVNKSLCALGHVLQALSERKQHIPYRDSKLTHVLQDAIGGDAKMLLFVMVSPEEKCSPETSHTLQFGVRARQCRRGQAPRQQQPPSSATEGSGPATGSC